MKNFIIILSVFVLIIGSRCFTDLICPNTYFNHVIEAIVVAVIICCYQRIQKKFAILPCECISTPCEIVYDTGTTLLTSPYLDLRRKEKVWGISVGDIYINKNETLSSSWEQAHKIKSIANTRKYKSRLPALTEMLIIRYNREKINQTIEILRANEIKADHFSNSGDDKYWCIGIGLWGKTKPMLFPINERNIFSLLGKIERPKADNKLCRVRNIASYF